MPSMGNTGASSLVKSSASAANAIADYNDKIMAAEWDNSAQTDADYQQYTNYLNTRMETLSKVGTLSSASKVATIMSTVKSANRSYTSNVIQRTQQDILNGDATSNTKLETIRSLYEAAVNNGDNNLAQNLYTQYQTLDQQIQYDNEVSAKAATTLAKETATAQAEGYTGYVDKLKSTVADMYNALKEGGSGLTTAELKKYADKLGIELNGAAPSFGSLVQGALAQTREAYALAATATADLYPTKAASYIEKVNSIDNDTYSIGGLNMTQATGWATRPESYTLEYDKEAVIGIDANGKVITGATYKPVETPVIGYTYDPEGSIVPIYSKDRDPGSTIYVNRDIANNVDKAKDNTITELNNLGLNVTVQSNGNMIVNTTKDANGKVTTSKLFTDLQNKYGIDNGTDMMISKVGDGYQLLVGPQDDQKIIYVAKDDNSNYATYEMTPDLATGGASYNQIGTTSDSYNVLNNSLTRNTTSGTILSELQNKFKDVSSLKTMNIPGTTASIARDYLGGNQAKAFSTVDTFIKQLKNYTVSNIPQTTVPNIIKSTQLGQQNFGLATSPSNNNLDAGLNPFKDAGAAKVTTPTTNTTKTVAAITPKPAVIKKTPTLNNLNPFGGGL